MFSIIASSAMLILLQFRGKYGSNVRSREIGTKSDGDPGEMQANESYVKPI